MRHIWHRYQFGLCVCQSCGMVRRTDKPKYIKGKRRFQQIYLWQNGYQAHADECWQFWPGGWRDDLRIIYHVVPDQLRMESLLQDPRKSV